MKNAKFGKQNNNLLTETGSTGGQGMNENLLNEEMWGTSLPGNDYGLTYSMPDDDVS